MGVLRDLISKEEREFKCKIGSVIASSLAGFLAGVIVASIVWGVFVFLK